ncbi:MAG: hypothetical protein ABNH53_15440 [Henriciella sp.]
MIEQPDDDGPNWWPKFSSLEGLIWLVQGFALPFLITSAVFVLGLAVGLFRSGLSDFDAALKTGRDFVILGFILGGGGFSLTIVSKGGFPRWRTFIRICGLTLGMIAYWQLVLPFLIK